MRSLLLCTMGSLLFSLGWGTLIAQTTKKINSEASPTERKAAAAEAVITLQVTMYLSGFGSREVLAEGSLVDRRAKALAIEDSAGTRFVTVTLDLIEVTTPLRDAVFAGIKGELRSPERSPDDEFLPHAHGARAYSYRVEVRGIHRRSVA